MPVSEATYRRVALEDPEGHWELACGRLRGKPAMTTEHNEIARELNGQLRDQLDRRQYAVSEGSARLRVSTGSYYEPDVCVIPRDLVRRLRQEPGTFEMYDDPMPLVVEVWSPSTGAYDVDEKVVEYKLRGDAEIWLIHPYERILTAWRHQSDGSYVETIHTGGTIEPIALPNVTIDLDTLYD